MCYDIHCDKLVNYRQNKSSHTKYLHLPSLELPQSDDVDNQPDVPDHLPLYRTVSAGTINTRRSTELTNSMTGVLEEKKEMKKENFDMKLKLFFLEERLGIGIGGETMKKLSDENIELKVRINQKYLSYISLDFS